MKKKYCIKEDYISRDSYYHYDDTSETDEYQDKVYETAYKLFKKNNFNRVLDIGCGSGYKLIKYFKDYNFVGLEIEPTLSWLKKTYPNHNWRKGDFSHKIMGSYDIIICADVIEHLVDPDDLINYLKNIDFKYAIISTPERNAIRKYQKGYTWNGPPNNLAHIREWEFTEFNNYISLNFHVIEHFMSQNFAETSPLCQIIVVRREKT